MNLGSTRTYAAAEPKSSRTPIRDVKTQTTTLGAFVLYEDETSLDEICNIPKNAKVEVYSQTGTEKRFKLKFQNFLGFANNEHILDLKIKVKEGKLPDVCLAYFNKNNDSDGAKDNNAKLGFNPASRINNVSDEAIKTGNTNNLQNPQNSVFQKFITNQRLSARNEHRQQVKNRSKVETQVYVEDGIYQTVSLCTLRNGEDLFSKDMGDTAAGTKFKIVALGKSRRAQVKILSGERRGLVAWLSLRTSFLENLVGPVYDGRRSAVHWKLPVAILAGKMSYYQENYIGAVYDLLQPVLVYNSESLSSVMGKISRRMSVQVLAVGCNFPTRCKIETLATVTADDSRSGQEEVLIGWIDSHNKNNERVFGQRNGWFFKNSDKEKQFFDAARRGDVYKLAECLGKEKEVAHLKSDSSSKSGKSMMRMMTQKFSKPVDVNITNPRGQTALIFAAMLGRVEAVQFLLNQKGIIVDSTDATDKTPLHWACVKKLFVPSDTHAVAEGKDGKDKAPKARTSVEMEAQVGDTLATSQQYGAVIGNLLQYRANIHARDFMGNTPLMYAVMRNDMTLIQVLCQQGADLTATNANGMTAFGVANIFNKKDICMALAKFGAKDQFERNEFLDLIEQGTDPKVAAMTVANKLQAAKDASVKAADADAAVQGQQTQAGNKVPSSPTHIIPPDANGKGSTSAGTNQAAAGKNNNTAATNVTAKATSSTSAKADDADEEEDTIEGWGNNDDWGDGLEDSDDAEDILQSMANKAKDESASKKTANSNNKM